MKKYFWIGLPALTALLLAPPGSRSGDDKAKELLDKMEKKLTEAKTLQIDLDGKIEAGGAVQSSVKGTLLLAPGNKMRMEFHLKSGGKEIDFQSISDGAKMRNYGPSGTKEKDTSKRLNEDL